MEHTKEEILRGGNQGKGRKGVPKAEVKETRDPRVVCRDDCRQATPMPIKSRTRSKKNKCGVAQVRGKKGKGSVRA